METDADMSPATRNFVRHYVEMVIAMFVGMGVLGAPAAVLLDVESETLRLFNMAVFMTAGMVSWMRYRGHGWMPCAEMSASMFLPTFAAIGLLSAGVIDFSLAMTLEHVVMMPAMLVAMLLRRDEYTGHVHRATVAA
jgi:flagellar biosynthetic protein FliP